MKLKMSLCHGREIFHVILLLSKLVNFVLQLDEELEALQENGECLCGEKEVISLCRLMVRVETMEQRLTCLKLIQVNCNIVILMRIGFC